MDSFASSIVKNILEKVGSYAYQQIVSAWGVDDEIRKLKDTLEDIQAVLGDAEERQVRDDEPGRQLKIWLQRFKDVLHDIKDVLDDFEIQDRKMMVLNGAGTLNKVCGFFSSSNSIAFRFKMSQKINKIWERLNEIKTSKNNFKLSKTPTREIGGMNRKRETHSYVDALSIIGRDEDRENIVKILLQQPDDHSNNVSIISIVGLGGLGKTTLAKLVCNDTSVVEHFDLIMWICVSEEFDVKNLIKDILKSTKAGLLSYDGSNLEKLQGELRHALEGKRFLLVLDDVWNDKPKAWDELNQFLIGGSGSKILVTTRSKKVASVMKSNVEYDLDSLSHENCRSLFLRWACIEGQEERHKNLVGIGNEIVKKCKGNPLAAKTLGSLLSLTTDEKDWESIRDSELWKLEQEDDDIMPALKLSYNHMPPHLRSCFAYCAVFPKDFMFNSVDLIQLWLANGLIPPHVNPKVEMGYVGMQNLKELFGRCFFEDVEEYIFFYTFKMHDLMHDLALSVAQNELLTVGLRTESISKSVRHLSLLNANLFEKIGRSSTKKLRKRLRTIVCPLAVLGSICEYDVGNFVMGCKHLWVLDLSSSSFEELPISIGQLKHLRYFSLSGNRRIRRLPTSICKLQKLQTLGLVGCKKLESLPRGFRNMVSLRFIEFTTNESELPNGEIGCLASLQVLTISGCQSLRNLFDDMKQLAGLRTLSITDCDKLRRLPCSVNDLIALENLLISNCAELNLEAEDEDQNAPLSQDQKLCSLRSITITKMTNFKALPQRLQQAANSLSSIIIEDCPNFQTLPDWLKNFKSLSEIRIAGCPNFKPRED